MTVAEPASWKSGWAHLVVAGLAILAYANTVGHGFVWDDAALIEHDYRIRTLRTALASFHQDFFASGAGYGYWRPAVTLSYALDFRVARLDPRWYHVTNVLLHCAASLLVLRVARRVDMEARSAALGAAIFAVHPVHTESVAWISGRTDPLATVFMGVAFLGYLRLAEGMADRGRRRDRAAGWALGLVGFVLALTSKEVAVAFPLVVTGHAILARPERAGRPARPVRIARLVAPYWVVLVAYLVMRARVVPPTTPAAVDVANVLSFLAAVPTYLGTFVFPWGLTAYRQTPYASFGDPAWVVGAVALGISAAIVTVRRPAIPWSVRLGVFALWALLVPVSNLVRVSAPSDMGFPVADRFLYAPSVPLALLGGAVLVRALGRAAPAVRVAGVALVLASYVAVTVERNEAWRDDLALFADARAGASGSALLDLNYGIALRRAGQPAEAVEVLGDALVRLEPGSPSWQSVNVALAGAYAAVGEERRARQALDDVLAVSDRPAPVLFDRGLLHEAAGRRDQALADYAEVVRLEPRSLMGWLKLAEIAVCEGRSTVAEGALARAREIDPRRPDWAEHRAALLAGRHCGVVHSSG